MANERHTDVRAWELDSSTRQSVHPYTKYKPFRQALSTTPVNLISVARGEIATNWVINPSVVATDISMFTAVGSTVTKATSPVNNWGSTSLKSDLDNSAAGEGFYWESPMIPYQVGPQFLSGQLEHYGASASGAVKLEIRAADGTTVLATSAEDDLATSWQRLTAQYTVPGSTAATTYRLYLTSTASVCADFYADKIMFEVREDTIAVSSYIDGNYGLNHTWSGTEHFSTSFKRPDMEIIKGITLTNESSTANEIVYVAFDIGANTSNTGIAVVAGATFEPKHPIDFRVRVSAVAATGTPTVSGVIWGTSTY